MVAFYLFLYPPQKWRRHFCGGRFFNNQPQPLVIEVGVNCLHLALFSIAVVACCRYDDMVNHIDAHCLGCFLKLCRYRIIIAACLVVAAWVVMNERERCGVVE